MVLVGRPLHECRPTNCPRKVTPRMLIPPSSVSLLVKKRPRRVAAIGAIRHLSPSRMVGGVTSPRILRLLILGLALDPSLERLEWLWRKSPWCLGSGRRILVAARFFARLRHLPFSDPLCSVFLCGETSSTHLYFPFGKKGGR